MKNEAKIDFVPVYFLPLWVFILALMGFHMKNESQCEKQSRGEGPFGKPKSLQIAVMVPEVSEGYNVTVLSGIEDHLLLESSSASEGIGTFHKIICKLRQL